jgi:hypothetical protein
MKCVDPARASAEASRASIKTTPNFCGGASQKDREPLAPGLPAGLFRHATRPPGGLLALLPDCGFEAITQRAVVAALEASFLALPLPGLDQVLQTARALDSRFTALGAAPIPLHAQLIFPLPRDRQICEFVFDSLSHYFHFRPVDELSSVN